jgi:uncharacterized membrane protein YhaH (DUF805 family)
MIETMNSIFDTFIGILVGVMGWIAMIAIFVRPYRDYSRRLCIVMSTIGIILLVGIYIIGFLIADGLNEFEKCGIIIGLLLGLVIILCYEIIKRL